MTDRAKYLILWVNDLPPCSVTIILLLPCCYITPRQRSLCFFFAVRLVERVFFFFNFHSSFFFFHIPSRWWKKKIVQINKDWLINIKKKKPYPGLTTSRHRQKEKNWVRKKPRSIRTGTCKSKTHQQPHVPTGSSLFTEIVRFLFKTLKSSQVTNPTSNKSKPYRRI